MTFVLSVASIFDYIFPIVRYLGKQQVKGSTLSEIIFNKACPKVPKLEKKHRPCIND